MAWNLTYKTEDAERFKQTLCLRINRRKNPIMVEAYDGIYFDEVPAGKYQYYCRHSDYDFEKIISIKAERGLTVNFWGTIVTSKPINFNGREEVNARSIWFDDSKTYEI